MKIAIVRQRYNPYGGAERFVARALPALERGGADVTLISRSAEGWGARQVERVDPFYLGSLWRDWAFARAARAAWRRLGFDVVQSHERIPGCDLYRAGDGVHRRWLELRRAAAGLVERLAIALNPYHRYVCGAERRMFEHPRLRAVICNSRMVRDEIQRAFRVAPEKLHVIYSGVDLEHFHPRLGEALRGKTRAELGCRPRDTLFLFVGSGFARKGLEAAIAALAQANNESFWLVVVGTDRDEARYRNLAGKSNRVVFLGGREDVRPLYAAADCLVLPTRYDPFPNTVLEAFAMGLPAIVSSRCGAAEIVETGVNGWICEPDDAANLSRLMQAADQAVRTPRPAQAARATAERFGIDGMAGRLADLYGTLAAGRA
ncbi:MAG: UDP-glucose:(heptosyl)LPS alpha,3-glucosyltransferase [Betaproteobacteria bacterium]|jgi:UDP-glucose:(heptosyl)LPS alpha-1,3-glucosyltransferase|nr:UDP-glucose:(heptosyl)LPS alpha,3-glucosyltransferase [Betaproteobacteria bacterium]